MGGSSVPAAFEALPAPLLLPPPVGAEVMAARPDRGRHQPA